MNEAYSEWLVKRKPPVYAIAVKAVMIVLCIFSVFLALTTVLGVIALLVVGGISYFVFQNLNLEFEYLFVNGQLSIDKIMGRARRKQAWEGTMETIQIVAPSDSYVLKDYETSDMKVVDYSSGQAGAKTYALINKSGGNTTKVIFEPNDRMLHCMKQVSPRKIVQ
ncbi:hypothetical protein GPL15_13780 [Clostridium sp. MCC353]|uniref:DUF6106 family protein n=1 Tax=Clostridium sp. MCC353 TaxID=2592646 RepID=UPI001C0309EA|nr:DUF6106 family protein [Clostridium sp. MCC353]MBT9777571.1 hypothetical protein [Clostridium sp. MCC353]